LPVKFRRQYQQNPVKIQLWRLFNKLLGVDPDGLNQFSFKIELANAVFGDPVVITKIQKDDALKIKVA
jgi:hypothetical protein